MARQWRCLFGWHDWIKFESSAGEFGARCGRCRKVDWSHHEPEDMSVKWRSGGAGTM